MSDDFVVKDRPPESETVLEEAQRLVTSDRGAIYGHPYDDFSRTVGMWNALLGVGRKLRIPLEPQDLAEMMILLKLSREQNRPKRDNVVDIAGYVLTLDMVKQKVEEEA